MPASCWARSVQGLRGRHLRAVSSSCPGIHRQPSAALDCAHHRATNTLASVASAKSGSCPLAPRACGRVVRLMLVTGRAVVRLDPPHPNWRGTLRSFRSGRLVICS